MVTIEHDVLDEVLELAVRRKSTAGGKRAILKVLLLGLCFNLTCNAQITLSQNTVSLRWIGDNFNSGPWFPDIAVTGTGTISQGACTGNSTLCSALNSAFTSAIDVITTTAPATLTLWTQTFTIGPFVGTAVSHLTINSTNGCAANCVIDITYVGQARSSLYPPTITSPSGSFVTCTVKTNYDGWDFWDNDQCLWQPNQVPGGTFERPGAGNSYTDGNFGGVPTQLNEPGFGFAGALTNSKDSAGTIWNSDHSRFMTEYQNGQFLIWNTSTKSIEFGSHNNLPSGDFWWDCCNPSVYFYATDNDNNIHKVTLTTGPDGWTDNGTWYVYPGTGPIVFGGNPQATVDNLIAFATRGDGGTPGSGSPDRKICVVDLTTPSTNPCTATFPTNLWAIKGVFMFPGRDSVSGYYYIMKSDAVQNGPGFITGDEFLKWKPGDANITHWAYLPVNDDTRQTHWPSNGGVCNVAQYTANKCQSQAHQVRMQISGRQFLFTESIGFATSDQLALYLISAGDLMTTPVELGTGGGRYASFSLCAQNCDTHPTAAASAPIAVVGVDSDTGYAAPSNQPNLTWPIVSATTASPIHITIGPSYVAQYIGGNGDVLVVSNLYPNLTGFTNQVGTHGLCTVANLSMDKLQFDCAGTTGSGTYSNSSTPGYVTQNQKPPWAGQGYQNEILILDFSNLLNGHTYTVKRWGKMRSLTYSNTALQDSYYGQGHPNMSPDGMMFNYLSNFGFPAEFVLMLGSTGYTPPPTGAVVVGGKMVFGGKVVVQ